jgi:hypothetical protein
LMASSVIFSPSAEAMPQKQNSSSTAMHETRLNIRDKYPPQH